MTWIKANQFLFGFLVAMVVGIGVLAFLLLGAMSRHDEAQASYEQQASELNRLKTAQVFPSESNLAKLADQKKEMTAAVAKLTADITAQQFPLEPITPEQFQDRLRAAVSGVQTKAKQANPPIGLPENFFLGFSRYETAPPDREAAAALGRQLKTVEWVVAKLIENRVTAISGLTRPELPEEGGGKKDDEKKPAAGKGPKGDKDGKSPVVRHPFEIAFVADPTNFRAALNEIVNFKGQFLIPRSVTVKSTKPEGPTRVAPGSAAALAAAAAAGGGAPAGTPGAPPGQPGAAPKSEYIVGEERVEVSLVLEMAQFAQAATAAATAAR